MNHTKYQPSSSKRLEIIPFWNFRQTTQDRRHPPLKNYSLTELLILSGTKRHAVSRSMLKEVEREKSASNLTIQQQKVFVRNIPSLWLVYHIFSLEKNRRENFEQFTKNILTTLGDMIICSNWNYFDAVTNTTIMTEKRMDQLIYPLSYIMFAYGLN